MSQSVVEDTPRSLRQQAEKLRSEAQASFSQARAAGQAPDRTLIFNATRQAKELERRAMELEDRSNTHVQEDTNVSQAQRDMWAEQALISKVTEQLFISGFDAIQNDTCLEENEITHILSACRYHLPSSTQQELYTCLSIPVLDTADQNVLQYFDTCNTFIKSAVDAGGKILIHCHAGQSRSATVLAAFLMQQDQTSVRNALDRIKRVRRVQPNDNFMNQLRLYSDCDYKVSEDNPMYRRWKFEAMAQALAPASTHPEQKNPLSGTSGPIYQDTDSTSKHTQIRCKKCRFVLASENHIIKHEPKLTPDTQPESQQSSLLPASCAHFFLEPIRWMKTELDRGELDGRFTCPNSKCGAKIGSYAWQGMTCSCRRWVLPALCIQRSKVDELKSKDPAKVEPARKAVPKVR